MFRFVYDDGSVRPVEVLRQASPHDAPQRIVTGSWTRLHRFDRCRVYPEANKLLRADQRRARLAHLHTVVNRTYAKGHTPYAASIC